MAKTHSFGGPEPVAVQTTGPTIAAPQAAPALSPSADLAEVVRAIGQAVATLASSQAQANQTMGTLVRNQERLTADLAGAVAEQEEARRKKRDEDANCERKKKAAEKTNQQTTQEIADRLWPVADDRYSVALIREKVVSDDNGKRRSAMVADEAHPVIEINAGSAEEANGRYQKLCGIVATEHRIQATRLDASDDAAALERPARRRPEYANDERLPAGVETM